MPPREAVKRKILADWLRKAEADWELAEYLAAEGARFASATAFHCQQAVEKYLKSFLVWREINFPKTHDLDELLALIEPVNPGIASSLRDVIVLTPYGVELRYPGDRLEASPDEAREAVELTRRTRDAILPLLPR